MSQNYLSIITKFTPISPNDIILKKRFYKEMTCLYDTKWQHYFIQITYNKIFVCFTIKILCCNNILICTMTEMS